MKEIESSHPLLVHPLPTYQLFSHPRQAHSLARLFHLSAWKRKGDGCYAGYLLIDCPLCPTCSKRNKKVDNHEDKITLKLDKLFGR